MAFDVNGARAAGWTDPEILAFMRKPLRKPLALTTPGDWSPVGRAPAPAAPFVGPRLPMNVPPPESTMPGTMQRIGAEGYQGPQYTGGPLQLGQPPDVGNLIGGIENVQGYGPQRAQGASELLRFGMEGSTPVLGPALTARPLSTLMGLGTGMAAAHGTEAGLRGAGVAPGYAQLAGDVAGLASGVGVGALQAERPTLRGLIPGLKGEEGAARLWRPGMNLDEIDERIVVPRATAYKGPLDLQDLARYLEVRVQKTLGALPDDAPPDVKLKRTLSQARRELIDQLTKPPEESGINWYDEDSRLTDSLHAELFPELATDRNKYTIQKAISAVMSSGQNPLQEARWGSHIWDGYRNSGFREIPLIQPSGLNWPARGADLAIPKIARIMQQAGGEEPFVELIRGRWPVSYLKQFNPNVAGPADAIVPGSMVLGPKLGEYFNALAGLNQDGTVIDIWMTRQGQRHWGRLIDDAGKRIEAPSPSARQALQQSHDVMARGHDLTPNQVQSLLWHYEQDLYRRFGVRAPSFKRSEGVLKFFEDKGRTPRTIHMTPVREGGSEYVQRPPAKKK